MLIDPLSFHPLPPLLSLPLPSSADVVVVESAERDTRVLIRETATASKHSFLSSSSCRALMCSCLCVQREAMASLATQTASERVEQEEGMNKTTQRNQPDMASVNVRTCLRPALQAATAVAAAAHAANGNSLHSNLLSKRGYVRRRTHATDRSAIWSPLVTSPQLSFLSLTSTASLPLSPTPAALPLLPLLFPQPRLLLPSP